MIPFQKNINFNNSKVRNAIIFLVLILMSYGCKFINKPSNRGVKTSNQDTGYMWKYQAKQAIYSSILLKGDFLYFGTRKTLCALRTRNGNIEWELKASGEIYDIILFNDSILCFKAEDSSVYGVNLLRHNFLWHFKTSKYITTPLAIFKDKLYFISLDKNIYCVNPLTGNEIKIYQMDSYSGNSAMILSKGISFSDDFGNFYTFDESNNIKEKFRIDMKDFTSFITNISDTLYSVDRKRNLQAWDMLIWKKLWSIPNLDSVSELPIVYDGKGYLASSKHYIAAFDTKSGQILWKTDCSCVDPHNILIENNRLFFSSKDRFYSIHTNGTDQKLEFTANALILPYPCVSNKTLYFATDDSCLYAVKYK